MVIKKIFKGTIIEFVVTSNPIKEMISSITTGIISAYIFYLIIDYLPKKTTKNNTIIILNTLLASILDSYKRERLFGHETAINYVDLSGLQTNWLIEKKGQLQQYQGKYLPLKFAMETAHSRIDDFRNALPLAVNLSSAHALQWLVIIDKVRLLADSYGQNPVIPREHLHLINENIEENPANIFRQSLCFRLLEYIEETINWLNLANDS